MYPKVIAFSRPMQRTLVFVMGVLAACQPMTRQDRATIGDDPAPTPANTTDPNGAGEQGRVDSGQDITPVVAGDWEKLQNALCQDGKPSGCSTLAYEALRSKKTALAIQYFQKACLMNTPSSQCAQSSGLARSCFELVSLYQQHGQIEEAAQFKACACTRTYAPACIN